MWLNIAENKPFLIAAGILTALGLTVFLAKRNNQSTTLSEAVLSDEVIQPQFKNGTVFIPTNQYDVKIVYGDETITNTDNRQYVGDNSTVNQPNIPNQPITTAPPQQPTKPAVEKITLTQKTSLFRTMSTTGEPVGALAPQTVEVVEKNGKFYKVKTWLGEMWIVPNYYKEPKKIVEYTVQKGDTLWGISQKFYNDPRRYVDIAKQNNIGNPNKIFTGQKLKIVVGG